MSARLGMRSFAVLAATAGVLSLGTAAHADADKGKEKTLLRGSTTASYFWDDGSGRAGDTGMPASGKPMQKGMAASPSWPLLTEGYVVYDGKKMPFFVGDRGPGEPSSRGIMLDLDAKTFAELTGGRFNPNTLMVEGNGGKGHIKVEYVITKWGDGVGKKNHPVAFSTGAWSRVDRNPARPPQQLQAEKAEKTEKTEQAEQAEQTKKAAEEKKAVAGAASGSGAGGVRPAVGEARPAAAVTEAQDRDGSGGAGGAVLLGGLALLGGGAYLGRERLRGLLNR